MFGVGFSHTKHTTNKQTTTDLSSRGFLLQIADLKIVVVYNASTKTGQAVAEGHSACAQSVMCRERGLPFVPSTGGVCVRIFHGVHLCACACVCVCAFLAHFVITLQLS